MSYCFQWLCSIYNVGQWYDTSLAYGLVSVDDLHATIIIIMHNLFESIQDVK